MTRRIYDLTAVPPPAEEPVLFHSLTLERRPRGWALVSSIAIHALVISLLMGVSEYLVLTHEDDFNWAQYKVEPLRLHISEPLYFKANPPAKTANTGVTDAPQQADSAAGTSETAATPSRDSRVPRHLELPAPHEIAKDGPTIIQPDLRPQIVAMPRILPPLAFWARQAADLPKPPARPGVVVPGRTEAPAAPPKLAALPVPSVPNREQVVADMNVTLPPAPAPPALPVPNSATMPVRLPNMPGREAASLDHSSGQPANVIALPTERSDARDVEIPRGLQNIPRSAAANAASAASVDGAAGSGAGARNNPSSGSGQGAAAAGAGQSANPARRGQGTASGPAAATDTAGSHRSPSGGGDPGAMPAMRPNVVVRPVAPPEVTRIEHPSNGNFDVVIMQSGTRDDLPDLGGMLTGNPVYTVYLRVGDQKEWLLEYCVPVRENIQASAYQVNVDDPGSVTPPYPISTAIPNTILGQRTGKHIVLHGLLTVGGTLQNVKGPETNTGLMLQLLAALSEWQFRPALRNKKPIEVEILLVIPPRA